MNLVKSVVLCIRMEEDLINDCVALLVSKVGELSTKYLSLPHMVGKIGGLGVSGGVDRRKA